MNGKRCPKCDLVNLMSATACHRCGYAFQGQTEAFDVSVPPQEMFRFSEHQPPVSHGVEMIDADNSTGKTTVFWFRIYCGLMTILYIFTIVLGVVLIFVPAEDPFGQNIISGSIYAILGTVLGSLFLVGLFMPRKPLAWIYGIVMIAIGMASCCFFPAVIPLLIFWIKPETQAYFGRKK
ncbi:MAG: hypothetical protein ACK5NT_12900 [Pyrinomonadaceae bacterium]